MPQPALDLKGHTSGYLTVVEKTGKKNHCNAIMWKCLCACGNTTEVSSSKLKRKEIKSCGCGISINRSPLVGPGEAGFTTLYHRYKKGANRKTRSIPFELTKAELREIVLKDCHYCGKEPSMVVYGSKATLLAKQHSAFTCSGIDRVDNTKGYIKDNCVPCCGMCNRMKLDYKLSEFITHAEKITKFQAQRLK